MYKGRRIRRIIQADGWYYSHTRGSHHYYYHPTKPGKVTVPGKPGDDLDKKTWHSILSQAGLKGTIR